MPEDSFDLRTPGAWRILGHTGRDAIPACFLWKGHHEPDTVFDPGPDIDGL